MSRVFIVLVSVFLLLAPMMAAVAQEEEAKSITEMEAILGDSLGFRQSLADAGINYEAVYTFDYLVNTNGGLEETGGEYRADASLFLEFDTAAMGLWQNGLVFMHIQNEHGKGITEGYVGDIQTVSNIDAHDFTQVSELWYQHTFADEMFTIVIGKQDYAGWFTNAEHGGEFISASPGITPNNPSPTYPEGREGLTAFLNPTDWLQLGGYVTTAFGNTDDTGLTTLWEATLMHETGGLAGQVAVAWWQSSATWEDLSTGETSDSSNGYYIIVDQKIIDNDDSSLGVFFEYSDSTQYHFEIDTFTGGGLEWAGPMPGRGDDIFGAAMFRIDLYPELGFTEEFETIYEVYYNIQVFPWFSVKPDFQYIVNPGASGLDNATVFGFRSAISF
jgi:porin